METKHIEAQLVYIKQLSFDRFRIPVYQRPYVWSCECALQLLGDIRESLDTGRQEYRIGSLILHELDNGELDIIDGQIVRITDNRVLMSLGDLSTEALYSLSHSEHLSAESTAQIKSNAYSFGCTFAEVEVDIPMCKVKLLDIVNVHDAGTLINPALAEAQVHGGMSMGIGFGLSENLLFDPKTGRALNNNLLDYKLSTFMDHPRLRAYFVENAEPTSAFGTKSLGEPPTCSIAPAIRNAVYQATGVYVNDAPVNPHHLFRSMKEQHMFEEGGEANV